MATTLPLNAAELANLREFHSSWPMRLLPDSLKPYAELIRIHRPAGIMMFYFPCLYGTFLVGALGHNITLASMIAGNLKLLLLSFFLRGVLCTWNDMLDQDIDRQVARTRVRPLARRAISTFAATVWMFIQIALVAGTYKLFPADCFRNSLPFLGLHIFYPFAKRVTHHPQLVLGFAHSLGVFIAFPTLGQRLNLWNFTSDTNSISAVCLSLAIIFWTLLNDTIYAAQDVEDDLKAGVGSTMIYWGESARMFLRALGFLQTLSLVTVSFVMRETAPTGGMVYNALTCGGTFLWTVAMVERVDLKDSGSCGWWFNHGNVMLGYAMGSGLVVEYLAGFVW